MSVQELLLELLNELLKSKDKQGIDNKVKENGLNGFESEDIFKFFIRYYVKFKDFDNLIKHLNNGFEYDFDKDMIYENLIYTYSKHLKDNDNAIETSKKQLSITTNKSRVYRKLGNLYLAKNDTTKALEYLELALVEGKDVERTYFEFGEYYVKLEKFKKAIEYFNKVIENLHELKKELVETRIACCYSQLKGKINSDKAIEFFESALKTNPKYIPAKFDYATTLFYQDKFEDSISEFKSMLSMNVKPTTKKQVLINLSLACMRFGEDEDVVDYLNEALNIDSNYKKALRVFGDYYMSKRNIELASDYYKKALSKDPKDVHSLHNLGFVTGLNGDKTHKKEFYLKSLDLFTKAYEESGFKDEMCLRNISILYDHKLYDYENALKSWKSYQKDFSKINDMSERISELEILLATSDKRKKSNQKLAKVLSNLESEYKDVLRKKNENLGFIFDESTYYYEDNFIEVLQRWNSFTPIVHTNSIGSKGGGHYLKINGYGIVIDPGFNFIENFQSLGYTYRDIDFVFFSHAHNDHTESMESILTLQYKYNNDREDYGSSRLWEYKDVEKKFPHKKIKLFMSPNIHAKYSGLLLFSHKDAYDIEYLVKGKKISLLDSITKMNQENDLEFDKEVIVEVIEAKHNDNINDLNCIGFTFIEKGKNAIVYTGDTGYSKAIKKAYENLKKDLKDEYEIQPERIILLANFGGYKDNELYYNCTKIDSANDYVETETNKLKNHYYKNHLGVLGLGRIVEILNPSVCLITEFGEEFDNYRINLSKEFDKAYDNTKFLPSDIGCRLSFDDKNIKTLVVDEVDEIKNDIKHYKYVDLDDVFVYRVRYNSGLKYYSKSQYNKFNHDVWNDCVKEEEKKNNVHYRNIK